MVGRLRGSPGGTPPGQHPFFSSDELRRLTVALDRGMSPLRATSQDAEYLKTWCECAVVGATMLELVLDGEMLPCGLSPEGVCYHFTGHVIAPRRVAAYIVELRRVKASFQVTTRDSSAQETSDALLSACERAVLDVATRTGFRRTVDENQALTAVLTWAEQCRLDERRLDAVLGGDLLPAVDRDGQVRLRESSSLSPQDLADYQRRLTEIPTRLHPDCHED